MGSVNVNCMMIAPKDLLIYLCLRRYMNEKTNEAKVSISKLTKQTSSSPVTVLNCLDRLVDSGYIIKQKRGRDMVYILQSVIEASRYDFLDEDIPVAEKISKAVDSANINEDNGAGRENEGLLYSYVVRLEEEITEMKRKIDIIVGSINEITKCTSLMMGREYKPLNFE